MRTNRMEQELFSIQENSLSEDQMVLVGLFEQETNVNQVCKQLQRPEQNRRVVSIRL